MAKCRNDIFMSKVGVNKLDKQTEVHFDVQRNLPDCKKINTQKYVSTEATAPRYNRYKAPTNQFECMRVGCVNSGTLYNEGEATVYKTGDATEFSAGVITFYAIEPTGGANAIVTLSSEATFTDAWEYTVDLTYMNTASDGYTAVVVDLTKTPTIIGGGWTPSEAGAYIKIKIEPTDASADMSGVAISSIGIFDDLDDFEISSLVIMSCLTGIDGSFDLSAAEATCFSQGGYDLNDLTGFEQTITGKALTPNYMILNPLFGKGEAVSSFDNETIEKTVEELTGTDYGYIMIADMSQTECGWFSAMLADSCNVTDSQLERLSIPSRVDLDEKHYQLIDNGDGSTTVLFNKEHIGAPVLISYPKAVDVEEWILSEDNLEDVRVRLSYAKIHTDGVKYRFVFDNVLITSFPMAQTEEETEFAFTINIQKDAQGRFGRAYRILG